MALLIAIVLPHKRFREYGLVRYSLFAATAAVLAALGVVLNAFSIPQVAGIGTISFVYLFMYLSGILLGPLWGGLIAALADILGFLIRPAGPYMWQITVSNFLVAFIVGLIFLIKINPKIYRYFFLIALAAICTAAILSAVYNPPTGRWSMSTPIRVAVIAIAGYLFMIGAVLIFTVKTKQMKHQWLPKLILGAIIAFFPTSMGFTVWALVNMGFFGGSTVLAATGQAITQPLWVAINIAILTAIVPPLNKAVYKKHPIA